MCARIHIYIYVCVYANAFPFCVRIIPRYLSERNIAHGRTVLRTDFAPSYQTSGIDDVTRETYFRRRAANVYPDGGKRDSGTRDSN